MQSTRFLLTFAVVLCGVRVAFAGSHASSVYADVVRWSDSSSGSASSDDNDECCSDFRSGSPLSDDDDQPERCSYGCPSVKGDCQEHSLPECGDWRCQERVKVKALEAYVKRYGMCDKCILKGRGLWGLSKDQRNEILRMVATQKFMRKVDRVYKMIITDFQDRTDRVDMWLMPLHKQTRLLMRSLMDVFKQATMVLEKEDFGSLAEKLSKIHPDRSTGPSLEDETIPSLSPFDDNDQPELSPDGGSVVEDDDLSKCAHEICQEKVEAKDLKTYVKKLGMCNAHFNEVYLAEDGSPNKRKFVTDNELEREIDRVDKLFETEDQERTKNLEEWLMPLHKQTMSLMDVIERATKAPKEEQYIASLAEDISKVANEFYNVLEPKERPSRITRSSQQDEKSPSSSPFDDNDQPELSPDGGSVVEDDDLPKCNFEDCQEKVKVKGKCVGHGGDPRFL